MEATTRLDEAIHQANSIADDVIGIGKVVGYSSCVDLWKLRAALENALNCTTIALQLSGKRGAEYRDDVDKRLSEHLDAEMKKTEGMAPGTRPCRDGIVR